MTRLAHYDCSRGDAETRGELKNSALFAASARNNCGSRRVRKERRESILHVAASPRELNNGPYGPEHTL